MVNYRRELRILFLLLIPFVLSEFVLGFLFLTLGGTPLMRNALWLAWAALLVWLVQFVFKALIRGFRTI